MQARGFRFYGFATVYLMFITALDLEISTLGKLWRNRKPSITALDLEISTLDLKFTNRDLTRVTRSLDFSFFSS